MPELELFAIDQIELSLTKAPATEEDFIMTKSQLEKAKAAAEDEDEDEADEEAKAEAEAKKKGDDEDDEDEEEDGDKKKGKKPPFNFEKADEPTRNVLAAVGRALTNISGLPAEVESFAKSASGLKTAKPDKRSEVIAFAKNAFPGLVEAVQEPLQNELMGVKTQLASMQENSELAAMRELAAELPGDPEVVAKRLTTFKKSLSEDDFNAYIEEQKGLKSSVSKSALFERQSSSQPLSGSAEEIIMQKAQAMVTKSSNDLSLSDAIDAVAKTDGPLWERHMEENRAKSQRR